MANTFGDGYIVKGMTCHPDQREGTQRWILCKKNGLSSRPKGGNSGDGYYVKGITCHPERSEGTQGGVSLQPYHHLSANARSLSPPEGRGKFGEG